MDLWSKGLAAYPPAHMLRCSLSARVLFPQAWKRLVRAMPLMRVQELAADREVAADDLFCHREVCHR
jgi:hypothetical protein